MSLRSSSFVLSLLVVAALPAEAKVKVVATTATLAALAKDVGGLDVEVVPLLDGHVDPHVASGTPAMVAALEPAELLVVNGLGLESGWLPQVLAQVKNPKLAAGGAGVLDASTLIVKLDAPAPEGAADAGNHPAGNPHYLLDPLSAARVAHGIAERLAVIAPAAGPKVRERATFIAAKLEEKARLAHAEVARKVPAERRRVAEVHRVLAYLAPTLGIEVVAVLEPRPGVPLDATRAAEAAAKLKQCGATALIVLENGPRPTARELAKASGARLAVVPGGPRLVGDTFLTLSERTTNAVLAGLGI
ncbi:MAG: zinc ABC transporter substrate-binding protein [Deltaproteobacteria bacterium]|nr:zinc ABC transporter substrate-binding protein [Deltaproteobacteria bacterium]